MVCMFVFVFTFLFIQDFDSRFHPKYWIQTFDQKLIIVIDL
jgi:hypothetical protein